MKDNQSTDQEAKTMKIQATFYTITNQVYKSGTYKSMKAMRNARERYEMQYGACLRTDSKEVA
jgi:hypothetical protein